MNYPKKFINFLLGQCSTSFKLVKSKQDFFFKILICTSGLNNYGWGKNDDTVHTLLCIKVI